MAFSAALYDVLALLAIDFFLVVLLYIASGVTEHAVDSLEDMQKAYGIHSPRLLALWRHFSRILALYLAGKGSTPGMST